MASTKTLAQMRAMVREHADQETTAPTTAFVDDTELDARINEALKQLYNLFIQTRGQEYFHEDYTFTSEAGVNHYQLPCRFFRLMGVTVSDGTRHFQVPTWEYQELSELRSRESYGGSTSIYEYRYRLQHDKLVIYPKPTGTEHTFTLDYVPEFDELVADGDTFDGVNGWERWATLTAAIDIATKEENFELAQALMAIRAVIDAQIKDLAGERDQARAPRIQDTRKDGGGHGWDAWFYEGGYT